MGMEDIGRSKKPIQQGEAGFLTQEQIDELEGHSTPAESTIEATVVKSEISAPFSPERRAEVAKLIGEEETKLGGNIFAVNQALEKVKYDGPSSEDKEAYRASLLKTARINESYTKMKSGITTIGTLVAGAGMMTMTIAAAIGQQGGGNFDQGIGQWVHNGSLSDKIGEIGTPAGLSTGLAGVGILLVGHTINKVGAFLAERKEEKKRRDLLLDDRRRSATA